MSKYKAPTIDELTARIKVQPPPESRCTECGGERWEGKCVWCTPAAPTILCSQCGEVLVRAGYGFQCSGCGRKVGP